MRYNIISYLIGDGIKNIAKNKKSTFTAIIIMVITMITVGVCLIVRENANAILNKMVQGYSIEVYIADGTTDLEKQELKQEIQKIEYVNPDNIQFINKRDAYYLAVDRLGGVNTTELMGYTEEVHPFLEIYVITLTDLEKLDDVVAKLEVLDHVESTSESEQDNKTNTAVGTAEANDAVVAEADASSTNEQLTQTTIASNSTTSNANKTTTGEKKHSRADTLLKFSKGVNIALIVLGGALIAFSVIIIGNTIKLTVHARRKEISIMKYVGATNNFIRAPFVVEGIIIGIISSLISVILLGGLYVWIKKGIIGNVIQNWLSNLNNMSTGMEDLLQFEQIFPQIMTIFLVIGIGIGVIGSIWSMKKYLKV